MKMALKRCESGYSANNCEEIKWKDVLQLDFKAKSQKIKSSEDAYIPYVSRKCPMGYKRQGCCKCFKKCQKQNSSEETLGDKDIHNYCLKEKSYESHMVKDYVSLTKMNDYKRYEPFGDAFIEKCKQGFTRVGAKLCVANCPLGWPDLGDRCMKTGDIVLMPFVWMVGDDAMGDDGG